MSRIKGRKSLNRMPIIGKIKIGIKATNSQGKEYPTSIDYFRATGMYAPLFHKEFGDKPNKLAIVFPSNNLDDVCNQRFELRDKAGRLFAYSDGEQFHIYNSKEEDYEPEVSADPVSYMEELREKCDGKWDETLTMKFVLIELKGIHGVWQLSTKGKASSIPNLINIFDQVYESAGMVQGVPFDLTIEKVKSQKPESKKNFPVLNLIPNVSTDNMQKLGEYLGHGETMKRLCVLTNDKIQEIVSGEQKSLQSGTIDDKQQQPTQPIPKQENATQTEDKRPANTISEAQRKRMFAIAKGKNVNNQEVKFIIEHFGYESSRDIKKTDYEKIISEIENFVSVEMIENN